MKTFINLTLTALIFLAFSGCQETISDKYMVNVPVYMDRQEF
jgi:hypothetical protein